MPEAFSKNDDALRPRLIVLFGEVSPQWKRDSEHAEEISADAKSWYAFRHRSLRQVESNREN
jgi:hypothetical protein